MENNQQVFDKNLIFDVNGKLAECDASIGTVNQALFSDEVIIAETNGIYSAYDINFKPLF